MSLRKDLTGEYTNNATTEFPDRVTIPLNDKRNYPRTTIAAGAGKKGGVKAGIANFAIDLLSWIQNKLTAGKFEVPSSSLGTIPGPFADDAAAATGGVEIGEIYYETTTGVVNVRLS